jgi:hypothetical protein
MGKGTSNKVSTKKKSGSPKKKLPVDDEKEKEKKVIRQRIIYVKNPGTHKRLAKITNCPDWRAETLSIMDQLNTEQVELVVKRAIEMAKNNKTVKQRHVDAAVGSVLLEKQGVRGLKQIPFFIKEMKDVTEKYEKLYSKKE